MRRESGAIARGARWIGWIGRAAAVSLALYGWACDSSTGPAGPPVAPTATPSPTPAYAWKEFNGHRYAASRRLGTWQEVAAEAVAAGGTLATINDAAENDWLTASFDGLSEPDQPHAGNCIWIGYQLVNGSWAWQDGTVPGYENICEPCYRAPGGTHMYLHTASHWTAGTWNYNIQHDLDFSHFLRGIIEVPSASQR